MTRRFFVALALLSLTLVPAASGALAQDMGMGPLATTQHPTLGSIVTDASGLTVYTWAGDATGEGTSACNGQCASAWPPVLVDADMAMGMMDMASAMSTIQRDDGSYQVALNGWPLYRFSGDRAPGDANGDGSNGFGARWSVVSADAMMQGM